MLIVQRQALALGAKVAATIVAVGSNHRSSSSTRKPQSDAFRGVEDSTSGRMSAVDAMVHTVLSVYSD